MKQEAKSPAMARKIKIIASWTSRGFCDRAPEPIEWVCLDGRDVVELIAMRRRTRERSHSAGQRGSQRFTRYSLGQAGLGLAVAHAKGRE